MGSMENPGFKVGFDRGDVTFMQVILNYKSFFEAFRLGFVDNGYTAVAQVLFRPLFKDHNICDQNGVPYAVDNQNANKWGKGQSTIPTEIQTAAGEDDMLQALITYFNDKVIRIEISAALKEEMLDAVLELVENCDLRASAKKRLKKYYESGNIGEFLARVFQRALLGNNNVASSKQKKSAADKQSESLDEFNGILRARTKPETIVPATIQKREIGYVTELYDAYRDAYNVPISSPADLDAINCRKHFERQRKNFYLAETIYEKTRDSITPGEPDSFEILKDEVEAGVSPVSSKPNYPNGLDKANAVLAQAGSLPLSYNTQDATYNWVGPGEKQGVCHMLVIEERLSWVDRDGK